MLSNKLTFSLVLVLMLALVAAPVMAQTSTTITPAATAEFLLLSNAGTVLGLSGITATEDANMPNLYDHLRNGGTIELQAQLGTTGDAANSAKGASPDATADEKKLSLWHRLIITEVMWGTDLNAGTPSTDSQWLEVYTDKDEPTDVSTTSYRIVYYPGRRITAAHEVIQTDFGASDATDAVWVLVDRVAAIDQFGNSWTLKGQSGNAVQTEAGVDQQNVVSMYRNRDLDDKDKTKYKADKTFGSGIEEGSWKKSEQSSNTSEGFVATPGGVHRTTVGGTIVYAKAAVTAADNGGSGVIFNEIRNDIESRPNQVDWIELYNNSASGTDPISVNGWRIRLALEDPAGGTAHTQAVIAVLPDYRIPPGGTLLIVGEDPARTHLARGFNASEEVGRNELRRGAQHIYFVAPDLHLPDTGEFLLVLKSGDKNNHEQFVDFAGNGFFTVPGQTNMYPLRGWNPPGDRDAMDFGDGTATFATARNDRAFGREAGLMQDVANERVYRPESGENRLHKDNWVYFGEGVGDAGNVSKEVSGIGYDPMTNPRNAPGSPGYGNHGGIDNTFDDNNNRLNTDDYDFKGIVTISEIMYDAGPEWNLVQWIELFNNSMDQAVDIGGWELEIRNRTDVRSYVDAIIEFDEETIIGPNQTLLIVADAVGAASDRIPPSRVYDLYNKHRRNLGLLRRHGTLLSETAFHIRLTAKQVSREGNIRVFQEPEFMDAAGNLEYDPNTGLINRDMPLWNLPERGEDGRRRSLVRLYEDNNGAGDRKVLADGLMGVGEAWREANENDLRRLGGITSVHYGHSDDIATPGYSRSSPLPVSLSSFRPVRDQATGQVVIRWITQSELNNAGFNILRSETKNGEFKVVNLKGIIPGHGTTSEKHVYEWADTTAKPNVVYYYQIEDVSLDGKRTTLVTTHLRGNVNAAGKLTTTWSSLKTQN